MKNGFENAALSVVFKLTALLAFVCVFMRCMCIW